MVDAPIPTGLAYGYSILDRWGKITELGENYRKYYILGQAGECKELQADLISKLTTLWGELYPKIEGRSDLPALESKFNKFARYYMDPTLLQKPENAEDLFNLMLTLREAIERLKITVYEGN